MKWITLSLSSLNFTQTFTILLICSFFFKVNAQSGTQIAITVDAGPGLIYLLLVIFFAVNFCTPVVRYIYIMHLQSVVENAAKEIKKASHKFSERMSDAGRRTSQSIRSNDKV